MIAWQLSTGFDKQQHLFRDKIETGYIVEAYVCSCEHVDFLIKDPKQSLNYSCQACGNDKFYSADNAWRNIDHFLYEHRDVTFSFEYDIESNDNSIRSLYITKIPREIDFLNRKVTFLKKTVYSLTVDAKGDLNENYTLRFNQNISKELTKNLLLHANKYRSFGIPDPGDRVFTLPLLRFFIKNKHLKDFDLCYWDSVEQLEGESIGIEDALQQIINYRNEKSIKVALYKNYLTQLSKHGRFFSSFIEVFSNTIQDVNLVVSFLKIDFEYELLQYRLDIENLGFFLHFLKNHYTEKQILRLFTRDDFSFNISIFRDTINEINYDRHTILSKFKKVPCKVKALHDEFVRCAKEKRYEHMHHRKLRYSKELVKPCKKIDEYEVRLPTTGQELYDWADELGNCMAGYYDYIIKNQTTIYGFFMDHTLAFAVEIIDNELIEASGKYNANLLVGEQDVLVKWYTKFFGNGKQFVCPGDISRNLLIC